MSTIIGDKDVSATLFGKTRRAVLSLLCGRAEESFYLRQISRETGAGLGAVQRELKQLSQAGIIKRSVQGRQVYYQANSECPLFAEIKALVAKSSLLAGGNICISQDKVADFCRRHHIHKLSLFGSVLRDDFGPDSDVDVLVEFEPGHVPGFFGLFDMEAELSSLFNGRKVDLRTPKDISHYFREQVIREAKVQYEETR